MSEELAKVCFEAFMGFYAESGEVSWDNLHHTRKQLWKNVAKAAKKYLEEEE